MFHRHSKRLLSAACLAIAAFSGLYQPAAASTATISTTASQQIKGWGAFPSYFRTDWDATTHHYDIFNKPAVADAIYASGLTFIRVDVEPRLYVSGNTLSNMVLQTQAVDDLVNQIQVARNHGVTQYIMSCWSPPAVWKDNGSINGGHLTTSGEPAFVAYYTKVIQTLNSRGVGLPMAISVQNEPDIAPNYDSCIYTDTPAGKTLWKTLVKDMRTSFNNNGLSSVQINGPECTNTDNDHQMLGGDNFPDLSSDPALNTAIGSYASHTYGECWWTPMISGMAAHPKDAYITEWSIIDTGNSNFGTTEINWATGALRHFASNMVDLPFNYWCHWNLWQYGTSMWENPLLSGDTTPIYSKRYWIFQKLWTNVRPGWIVHKMTCDDAGYTTSNSANIPWPPPVSCDTMVDLVAFQNPAGSQSAVLLINDTGGSTSMVINGLKGSSFTAFQTTASADMANVASGAVSGGSCTVTLPSMSVTVVLTQAGSSCPHGGTPWAVPGTIQAENYDDGGEGIAYHDSEGSNFGGQYRTDGVDIETCADTGTGYDVGWTAAGEWLKYTSSVAAGTYNINFRVAGTQAGTIHLEDTNGTNLTGAISTPNTGGFQTWQTVTKTNVTLTGGSHVFKLALDSGGFNVNYISFTLLPPATPTGLTATAGNTQVALSWTASASATAYDVKRSTVSGSGYATVASPTGTSYTNTGLTNGTTYYYVVAAKNAGGSSANSSQVSAVPVGGTSGPVKINTGGPAASPFVADADFSGGQTATNWTGAITTTGVTSPAPQAVYQSERYGAMTYTMGGLTAGTTYQVRLHFCENYFTAAGSRKFNVAINGTTVLTNFDIFATTGAIHKANVQQFNAAANGSGQIVIAFTNVTNNALVNGIEVNTVASGNTHAGTWACKAVLASGAGYTKISEVVGVVANSSYVGSVWIKGTGNLQLSILHGSWGAEATPAINIAATGSWQKITTPAFNTGSDTQMTFIVQDFVGGTAGTVYIDDTFLGVNGGANVLGNPGFESGNVNWGPSGVFSIVQNP